MCTITITLNMFRLRESNDVLDQTKTGGSRHIVCLNNTQYYGSGDFVSESMSEEDEDSWLPACPMHEEYELGDEIQVQEIGASTMCICHEPPPPTRINDRYQDGLMLYTWVDITYNRDLPPSPWGVTATHQQQKDYKNIVRAFTGLDGHVPEVCAACGQINHRPRTFLLCECKREYYCNKSCQRYRWKAHQRNNHHDIVIIPKDIMTNAAKSSHPLM